MSLCRTASSCITRSARAVPITQLALQFNAGFAADAPTARGLQSMTLSLLDEGTTTKTSQQIAEEQERLGAEISASGTADRSTVAMSALSANLAPSLDLMADIVRNPAFAPAEVERVRTQTLTGIAQQLKDPNSMASRALPFLLYGETHPYASTGIGDAQSVRQVHARRLAGVPADLAAPGQYGNLRRFRSSAQRSPG